MTSRARIGWTAVLLAVCGLLAWVAVSMANDESTVACSPGEWVHATVTAPDGSKLSVQNARQLPKGYSATTESGNQKVTVHDDGSVTAEGGAVTVECIAPTH